MIAKLSDEEKRTLLGDDAGWLEEFQNETDRATAVLGAAFLESQLELLLKSVMRHDAGELKQLFGVGAIGGFVVRARLAYCLDLISKETLHETVRIAWIRNRFAHGLHGLKFESPEISGLCMKLRQPDQQLLRGDLADPMRSYLETNARFRYITSVAILSGQIRLMQRYIDKIPPTKRTLSTLIKPYIIQGFDSEEQP